MAECWRLSSEGGRAVSGACLLGVLRDRGGEEWVERVEGVPDGDGAFVPGIEDIGDPAVDAPGLWCVECEAVGEVAPDLAGDRGCHLDSVGLQGFAVESLARVDVGGAGEEVRAGPDHVLLRGGN